jgi:hypothetical protein
LSGLGRAKHGDALRGAALHGWAKHDSAVFAKASAFSLGAAWEAHDRAVLSRMESIAKSSTASVRVAGVDLMAELWAEHDVAVFAGIEELNEGWRYHDEALLSMMMESLNFDRPVMPRQTRRRLARVEEMTTTLLRDAGYDQDTLFEGGAGGYSL